MLNLEVIQARRRELKLTKTAVADKIGISVVHYSLVEKGDRGVSIETLDALLKALDLNIVDVWVDDREIPPVSISAIIIEKDAENGKETYKLPPRPETFRLLEMRLLPGVDSELEAIASAWDDLDDTTKAEILKLVDRSE